MKRKQGISLIVLVITIIVMIILAASVVVTLSNTGIIDRAGQAVDLTNENQIQDFAALVWSDAYIDGERTQSGLESAVVNALTTNGVNTNTLDINVTTSGVSVAKKKIYTADEIAADSNIFAIGKTNANDIIAIFNPDTKTLTIKNNNIVGNTEIKDATYSSSHFTTIKANIEHVVFEGKITTIGKYLFRTYTAIKTVSLPNSLVTIGTYAFDGCTGLTEVKLPENLKTIESYAFDECTGMTKINIPSSVTTIGAYAILGKTVSVTFGSEFDITLETITNTAFANFTCSGPSAISTYKFATEHGDGTSVKVDKSTSCSSGSKRTNYEYETNITVNGKTRNMVYHRDDYCATCNY